jgi:hypothetical protein
MPGKIWEVDHASGTVWLVVSDAAPRLHRRILLAVDRSDSMSGSDGSLRATITELSRALDVGDVVVLWRMGEIDPSREIEIKGESSRNDLTQDVVSLSESRNGSWMLETWSEMRSVSANPKPGFVDFLIFLSDGELYDAGAVEARSAQLRWYRIRGGGGIPAQDFTSWAQEGVATQEGFKKDLVVPSMTARLQRRARGVGRAMPFDGRGRLAGEVPIAELNQVSASCVVLVGGTVDSARLSYTAGRSTVTEEAFERISGCWPEEPELLAVLKALGGGKVRWDKKRLQQLASGARQFRCQFDDRDSQSGQLFCIECGCCLLAKDRVLLVDIYPLRWKFPLGSDGSVGEAAEAGEDSSTGEAIATMNDEQGSWLVLDLGAA